MNEYQICTRCIMDTTDPLIRFDENGVCNHCHRYDRNVRSFGYKGKQTDVEMERLINKIKEYGKDKEYDCICDNI